jgi:carbamoyltransferase
MGYVLGISAFYHDSAAALVRDGAIIAAAQEERFTRIKHDPSFPASAIDYCLEEAFIDPAEIDQVVFYDDPVLTLDRILTTLAVEAPDSARQWNSAMRSQLAVKQRVPEAVAAALGPDVPVKFTRHHYAHAASAFYPSPFDRAAILTMDGVGEWDTTSLMLGDDTSLVPVSSIRFPHSIGLLYSVFTGYCGFKVNSGEYKLMGLAPYGEPRFADTIRDELIEVFDDGSFRLNLDYFSFTRAEGMTTDRFDQLFGGPAREQESRIGRREMDLAASIQVVTEEVVIGLARHAREATGANDLCLAGGVALNCVANGKLLREGVFDRIWIQPAAGDAGGALGAALLGSYAADRSLARVSPGSDTQHGSYLGPAYSPQEVQASLDLFGAPYRVLDDDEERADLVAAELEAGRVVGFFSGRLEFGPRSLGGRSILGDARNTDMQTLLNLKIKYRESFRPFAPAVLEERAADYFEIDTESPYMLLVAPVVEKRRLDFDRDDHDDDMLAMVRRPRSDLPAITHLDYSARVQTVSRATHPRFHELLTAFEARTGCGVLVNTSFNVRGEPIVTTPAEAYTCFMRTEMDVLVLENAVLFKADQPEWVEDENWRERYDD